jgi:hypothetical protein
VLQEKSLNLCLIMVEERSKLFSVCLVFIVTTVDSGSKALEFLGLRQSTDSNDPNAFSKAPVNHQVCSFIFVNHFFFCFCCCCCCCY